LYEAVKAKKQKIKEMQYYSPFDEITTEEQERLGMVDELQLKAHPTRHIGI
jgi:hypothetical protein